MADSGTKSIQSLPFGRAVLLIGDEALCIYKVTAKAVLLLDRVPWQADGFLDIVTRTIKKECKFRPLLILNDMTDQHFKGGQRITKVGPLDKANVIKRKLNVAFPSYPIRGALKIATPGGAKASDGSERYLFAGVPASEQIAKTVHVSKMSLSDLSGFYLLPVEAASMVNDLAAKISKKEGREPGQWVVFVGQHHGGALRQIIVRNGQLAMTRMTPIIDSDEDPARWAQEVNNEFKATVSYLSRFGFTPEDGVDIISVANSESGIALGDLLDISCNYHSFTSMEIAKILGMKIGVQDDPRYADALHVSWVSKAVQFAMPMISKDIGELRMQRLGATAAMFCLIGASLFFAGQMKVQTGKYLEQNKKLTQAKKTKSRAQASYSDAERALKEKGIDIKYIRALATTYEEFEADTSSALPIISVLGKALEGKMRIDKVDVSPFATEVDDDEGTPGSFVSAKRRKLPVKISKDKYSQLSKEEEERLSEGALRAIVKITYLNNDKKDESIRNIANLIKTLKSDHLKDYKVYPVKEVESQDYAAVARGSSSDGEDKKKATESLEIVIIGPLNAGNTGS